MTAKYHDIITQIIVKPEGEPIMSEMATTISISDEAAGMFIEVSQMGGAIRIDEEEWPAVRDGIDRMFLIIQENDTNK
jgi:hypothetical protein